MSKKYLTGINLNRNEIQNAIIQNLGSAPSSPTEGLIYYDTTLGKFGVYNGTSWVYMGDSEVSDYVDLTTAQSVGGVKTFSSFPVTPSSAPTSDYQVANKKYVDDNIGGDAGVPGGRTAAVSTTTYTLEDDVSIVLTVLPNTEVIFPTASATYSGRMVDIMSAYGNTEVTGGASALLSAGNSFRIYCLESSPGSGSFSWTTLGGPYPIFEAYSSDLEAGTEETTRHMSPKVVHDEISRQIDETGFSDKLDNITVTAPTNLDDIRTRVNDLDAAVVLRGSWDASAGTFPGSGTAQAGSSYIVSVAGTVDGVSFSVNDRIVAIADNASATVYASSWLKLDYTDQVLSVNSQTGTVVLDADDIDDASTTNKFVTAADITKLSNLSGTNTGDEVSATTTTEGVVELATSAETIAKTDTTRAVTPSGLATFTQKHTELIGDGSSTSIVVTHDLGSQWVTAQVYDATTNEQVETDVVLTSSTQTTFTFASAPASDAYRVVIVG